jgi:poly(3-hydroxybutyrate) depolymerase
MKKISCALLVFCLITCTLLNAQNQGCDGSRYKNDVFSTVTKTTVVYAPTVGHLGGAMELSMDVYEPVGDAIAQRPVVILAHGGSFIFGDRSMRQRWCELLAKKGYVAATISYRLFPFLVLGFPDSTAIFDTAVKAVGDMRAAVRYFREDAATGNQFHADPDHIFIGGYSAGAVAALHCSYLDLNDDIPAFLQTLIANNGGLEGVSGTASNKTYASTSKAIVNMSGGLYRNFWINPTEVPIVSIHGTADETVPYTSGLAAGIAYLEGSARLHTRSNEINLWNSLHPVPGGGHTNIYDNAVYQPHIDTFWVNATSLLESLTCSAVATQEPSAWESDWSVSPNPSTGNAVQLHFPKDISAVDVVLTNVLGQVVFQQKSFFENSSIPVSGLKKGAYLIQLKSPEFPSRKFEAKYLMVD